MRVKPPKAALLLIAWLVVVSTSVAAQLAPPSSGGAGALDRVLQRLAEGRRVLMVAAHPDDEDTSLLSLMSLGYGAEAAYLALSRGEGGQNLIGSELGPSLGLVRSRELLSAREVDGTLQFFTRAYDFGYTRSLDEASAHWPPDSVLKDAVRVVRRFRPHVMVTVFSGTNRDGHGQHQLAGVTALAAFDAAGDPDRFPELGTEEGLQAWTPLKLYRSTRFDTASTSLRLETGVIDPRVGNSIYQISMASRSRHRSQDMGRIQPIGPRWTTLRLLEDRTRDDDGPEADIFDGIPPDQSPLAVFADSVRGALTINDFPQVSAALAARLDGEAVADPGSRLLLEQALAIASGLVMDAVAEDAVVVPGQTVTARIDLFNGGMEPFQLENVTVEAPEGWQVEPSGVVAQSVEPGTMASVELRLTVPDDAPPTQPYYLERPRQGSMYDWSATQPVVRGLAFQPPLLGAIVTGYIHDAPAAFRREITYRYGDQATGEVRREVRVVPLVDVKLSPTQVVWPASGNETRAFEVTLEYNGSRRYAGDLQLEIDGWPAPATQRFSFARAGESRTFRFDVAKPAGIRDAEVDVRAVAVGDDRREHSAGVELVDYPHIRATAWVRPATATLRVAPMVMPTVSRVGYIRGAADRVPEALAQIGLPVELLGESELAAADLSGFDVIIVGSRAYEADSSVARYNDRLLEYAEGGGLLIVQYQQYAFSRGGFAPYPLTINRPHDRVTDETAPVTPLETDHPFFNGPNRIEPSDWDGWPQERGLYFAGTWDDAYRPLIETHDPGRPPLQGGLLVAEYGAGTYVYTGLSFFRALPGGSPGAFKVFLNLMNLKPAHAP